MCGSVRYASALSSSILSVTVRVSFPASCQAAGYKYGGFSVVRRAMWVSPELLKDFFGCRASCRIIVCASVFVLFNCSFLFYGRRQFRSSCVGNNLLLG